MGHDYIPRERPRQTAVTSKRSRLFTIPVVLSLVLVSALALWWPKHLKLDLPFSLLVALMAVLCVTAYLYTKFLIQAAREHRESERRFQQMASNIRELFWMVDAADRKIIYVNEAFEEITGYSR